MTGVLLVPDGGPSVGMGHTGRCVALAQAFEREGWRVLVVSTDAGARRFVRANGVPVAARPRGHWDLAVSDTYRRPREAVRRLGRIADNVAAIDDLHQLGRDDGVVIIRPSIGERSRRGVLGGGEYVLLRREYRRRPSRRSVPRTVRRVFVMLGAYPRRTDLDRIRRSIGDVLPGVRIQIASGVARYGAAEVARRLARADLAVVSGGQSLNEALAVGTPTIVITTFANQERQVRAASRAHAALSVGRLDARAADARLRRALVRVSQQAERRALVRSAKTLVDGRGAERVARGLARAAEAR